MFLDPGDAVLVFSPHFPTYAPNIERRGAIAVYSQLRQENAFRPDLADIRRFVTAHPRAKAIFLNSPHNPTGGVATEEDLRGLAEIEDTIVAIGSHDLVLDLAASALRAEDPAVTLASSNVGSLGGLVASQIALMQ